MLRPQTLRSILALATVATALLSALPAAATDFRFYC